MFWGTKYVINKNLKHCQTNVCIPILNKNDVYFYLELYVLTCTFVLDYSYVEEFSIMKYYHRIGWIFSKLHLHPYHLLKTTFSIMSLCLKLNHCLIDWLIDWSCLMPTVAVFQLYLGMLNHCLFTPNSCLLKVQRTIKELNINLL
jgi:hypothetical protein